VIRRGREFSGFVEAQSAVSREGIMASGNRTADAVTAGRLARRVERLTRPIKKCFGIKSVIQFDRFSIQLPAEHMLPVYRRQHPKYDRFLPLLAGSIRPDATIIDVGANCGDTLALMVEQNPNASYICVEPDQEFYAYLLANIARIKAAYPSLNVDVAQCLAAKTVANVSLAGTGGTRHAVVGEAASHSAAGAIPSRTLDEIASGDRQPVRLIKVDVDGFDYDVLNSAEALLPQQKPLLFFECDFRQQFQKDGYIATIRWLSQLGYCDWSLFDNFGELVLRTASTETVLQLFEYVWKQHQGRTTRTIFYYDLLAATPADEALVTSVLARY
jgi:FkbM family methyltransferase